MRDRLRDVAHIRAKALALTRSFFADNGFIEVDTPIFMRESTFNIHIGEFTTQWKNPPNTAELFLHSSPEHYMKRLLVSGVDKIYQLVHFFRNGQGELGPHHQPEFMGLEFYEAFKDYSDIMGSTERFVRHLAQGLDGAILREEPFERLRVEDAFKRYADLDLGAARTVDSLREAATRCGILTNPDDAYDDLFFRVFIEKIESNLGRDRPTFLYDYPLSMAVMAKASAAHPHLAERVELYINGVELANGFTEENNAEIQRARFVADRRVIDPSGRAPLDEAFLGALAHGMPPAAGIAIGFDRLLMVLLGKKTIADVLPFPL